MYATRNQITPDFMNDLLTWQEAGERSIKIEIGTPSEPEQVSIFVYDYSEMDGMHIVCTSDLPTAEDLKTAKKAELLRQLEELEVQP